MTELAKFRVPVDYSVAPPDPEELFKTRFFRGGAWDPKYVVLDCCKDIPHVSCELEITVIDLGSIHGFENVVRELDVRGLRPLIYQELAAFIRVCPDPDIKLQFGWVTGLAAAGCYIQIGGFQHHPSYEQDADSGYWGESWPAGFGWRHGPTIVYEHFLATKK